MRRNSALRRPVPARLARFVTPSISAFAEYLHYEPAKGDTTFAPAPLDGTNSSSIDLIKGIIAYP